MIWLTVVRQTGCQPAALAKARTDHHPASIAGFSKESPHAEQQMESRGWDSSPWTAWRLPRKTSHAARWWKERHKTKKNNTGRHQLPVVKSSEKDFHASNRWKRGRDAHRLIIGKTSSGKASSRERPAASTTSKRKWGEARSSSGG